MFQNAIMRLVTAYLYFLFIVLNSCNHSKINRSSSTENSRFDSMVVGIFEIDPRKFIENELFLTDIASDITYISLDNNFLIGTISSFKITENSIYIKTGYDPVLVKYNRQGKNPIQIGWPGKGPGEYQWWDSFAVEPKNGNIYIHGKVNTIMVYTGDGNYLREFKLPYDPGSKLIYLDFFNNSYLLIAQSSIGAHALYNWVIIDTLGNVVSYKKNSTSPFETRIGSSGGIYKFKDAISYWVGYNDTVFSISPDFSYHASYVFTPGEHKMPKKEPKFTSPAQIMKLISQFYTPNLLLETNDYLINRFIYNEKYGFVIIDKKSKETFISYIEGVKDVYSGGVTNDLDGGPMFIPKYYFIEDSHEYLVGIVYPFQFKSHVTTDSYKYSKPKYPEKKKELENLADRLKETDNPIIMLIKLKK